MTMTTTKLKKTRSAGTVPLSETALLLLAQAALRPDCMVLPPPGSIKARGTALEKLLQRLLKRGLVAEVADAQADQAWRSDEAGTRIGLQITPAGRASIGIDEAPEPVEPQVEVNTDCRAEPDDEPRDGAAAAARTGTKQAMLIEHLSRPWGHSVAELARILGWQKHTVRAAITGLRKKATRSCATGTMRARRCTGLPHPARLLQPCPTAELSRASHRQGDPRWSASAAAESQASDAPQRARQSLASPGSPARYCLSLACLSHTAPADRQGFCLREPAIGHAGIGPNSRTTETGVGDFGAFGCSFAGPARSQRRIPPSSVRHNPRTLRAKFESCSPNGKNEGK
jgi:hypothetical protein